MRILSTSKSRLTSWETGTAPLLLSFPKIRIKIKGCISFNQHRLKVEDVYSTFAIQGMWGVWKTDITTGNRDKCLQEFKGDFGLSKTLNWMKDWTCNMQYDSNRKTYDLDGHEHNVVMAC